MNYELSISYLQVIWAHSVQPERICYVLSQPKADETVLTHLCAVCLPPPPHVSSPVCPPPPFFTVAAVWGGRGRSLGTPEATGWSLSAGGGQRECRGGRSVIRLIVKLIWLIDEVRPRPHPAYPRPSSLTVSVSISCWVPPLLFITFSLVALTFQLDSFPSLF